MINVKSIINNFLSDNQKSNSSFISLLNILVSYLQSDNFKNTNISPVNFTLNMSKINDINNMSEENIISKFEHIFPFKNKELLSQLYDIIPPSKLIRTLKVLYSLMGSENYLQLWESIVGEIIYGTTMSDVDISTLTSLNVSQNERLIYGNDIVTNVIKIENIDDIKVEYQLYLKYLMDIKNINTMFLILFSTNFTSDFIYQATFTSASIIEDVVDTTRYNNDFYQPFIRNSASLSQKIKYQSVRSKLNNLYVYQDVSHIKFGTIKDEGQLDVFSYISDDDIIYYPSSNRKISHIQHSFGENLMFPNEILNSNDTSRNFFNHINPSIHQSVIELDFSIQTLLVTSRNTFIVLSEENPQFLS